MEKTLCAPSSCTSFLVIAWLLILFGCKKGLDHEQRDYQYLWPFASHCGGGLLVMVPNSFSPNGDGVNEEWQADWWVHYLHDSCNGTSKWQLPREAKSFFIEVRDLKNELFYSSTNMHERWNGKKNNTGNQVAPGQFLWKFRLEDLDGVMHEENGTVNVMM